MHVHIDTHLSMHRYTCIHMHTPMHTHKVHTICYYCHPSNRTPERTLATNLR